VNPSVPPVSITISGHEFTIPVRYEEGDELDAGAASALNQTYREAIRNNLSKKEGLTQDQVNEYASHYEFGVRTPGTGRQSDPVMAEAMRLAKALLKDKLKAAGKKADADAITEAAKSLLSHAQYGPPIMEKAKARVAEAQSIASAELGDIINSIPEKQPEAQAQAEPQAA
jgi:hypothetical protein